MRNSRKLFFELYVGIVCLTLAFQTYIRLSQCAGTAACAFSIGQGAIWSAAWPASWTVYASDWFDDELDRSVLHANAAVDAEWYLSQYPDIRAAVQNGQFKSAEEHYRTIGFKQKRLPARPKFDEEFYLEANPDVAAAVQNGQFKSGYEHYINFGRFEGRKPSP